MIARKNCNKYKNKNILLIWLYALYNNNVDVEGNKMYKADNNGTIFVVIQDGEIYWEETGVEENEMNIENEMMLEDYYEEA